MRSGFRTFILVASLLCGLVAVSLHAQDMADTTQMADSMATTPMETMPSPVTNLSASNTPDDHGHSITLSWTKSADDGAGLNNVLAYEIMRAVSPDGPFLNVGTAPSGDERFVNSSARDSSLSDSTGAEFVANGRDYYYKIVTTTADSRVTAASGIIGPVRAEGEWFNWGRIAVLVAVLIFTLLTLAFISKAKKGHDLYVRPLAGIEAVDEAIGRATEMGKPILYVMGLGTAQDIATIASFTILSRVAKRVAEYQTDLIVPCYDPIAFTIAQEIVEAAFLDAGRPDAFKDDMVYFVTQAQFAFVAAVNGTMVRVKPATNLYLGKFYAESLMLAETGAVTGSIQISGTDEVAQIPFFVVACDYTLIGEELYAASAYLGREPLLLGSLKAQDWAKALLVVSALLGIIAAGMHWDWFVNAFRVWN